LQRKGLAKVIDSHMERVEKTFDDFKHRDFPRVAISVDMLDTGVDIPGIRNLVFAKPVFSYVKFWQMIGRGTRLWTDPVSGERKRDFLIIDHWDSFAYFQLNKEGRATPGVSEPLPTSLFRRRLEKLQILAGRDDDANADAARCSLQTMLAAIPGDNINVAPHVDELQRLATDATAWQSLDDATLTHLSRTIAPLLRFTTVSGWATLQFENLIEQLALAHLKADAEEIASLHGRVIDQLGRLPMELPEIAVHAKQLAWVQSSGFWDHLDYARIMDLQQTFAPLMRFRQRRENADIVRLTLSDEIAHRHWIVFGPAGEGAFVEAYRHQVEGYIRELSEENPALRKVKEGQELSPEELDSVSSLLNRPDLFVSEERLREAYEQPRASLAEFLKHILNVAKLPSREEQISQAFDDWVRNHPRLNATQLMFIRTLRQAVLSHARIQTIEELRQPPFNRIGDPARLFSEKELVELIQLATSLAA
jgi:type I restriction enzyme R subunit